MAEDIPTSENYHRRSLSAHEPTDLDCFVATTKPQVFALRIVQYFDLSRYFTDVYGSELDGTRTDKTELLRFAAGQRSGVVESVMIGDRHHDIVGALNNRFHAVGVTWGYGTEDELRGAGAHCLAAAPKQLPGLVNLGNQLRC